MEFAEKDDETEIESFELKPLEVEFDGLKKYITDFHDKIDENIAKSNNDPQKAFEIVEDSYDRRYLNLIFNGKIYGFVCMHYD